jgi:hypothetical protein
MNIIHNEGGMVTGVYNRDEINPDRGTYLPETIEVIRERYGFVQVPSLPDYGDNLRFQRGRLVRESGNVNIFELVLYDDGLSALTKNTDLSLEVISDVANYGASRLGWRLPDKGPSLIFLNSAIVEFDVRVSVALKVYDELKPVLDRAMSETYKQDASTQFLGFGFAIDPQTSGPISKKDFSIVRRIGYPYSGNRFYCSAPLPTALHHKCLQALEDAMRAVSD